MPKSLQKIEDYYVQQGIRGKKLAQVLLHNKEYQKILEQRKNRLKISLNIKQADKKKYVLSTNDDFEILAKISVFLRQKLSEADKKLVYLIRTQLEHDWRKPLFKELNSLVRKYAKIKK